MKHFLKRTFFFLFTFSIVGLLIYHFYIKIKFNEVTKNIDFAENIENKVDVILLGSSIEAHYDVESDSHLRISEIMDTLSQKKIIGISHPGFFMPTYWSIIDYFKERTESLDIIIPINFRSFSESWYLSKFNQFRDFDYYLSIFNFFQKEYNQKSNLHKISLDCNKDYTLQDFLDTFYLSDSDNDLEKCVYYEFEIERDNFTLIYLEKILNNKYENLNLFFYFEPLDYKSLDLNQNFYLEQNKNLIRRKIETKNFNVIDISKLLGSDFFDYNKTFNEHTKQVGKFYTAKAILDSIDIN